MAARRVFINYLRLFPCAWLGLAAFGSIDAVIEGEPLATGLVDGLFGGLFYGSALLILFFPAFGLVLAGIDSIAARYESVGKQNLVAVVGICGPIFVAKVVGESESWDTAFVTAAAALYALLVLRLPPVRSGATGAPLAAIPPQD